MMSSPRHGHPTDSLLATVSALGLPILLGFAILAASPVMPTEPWLTLPQTPTLPKADVSGYAPVNSVRIWYAEFGQGEPVLFVHGGLANSNYWGHQVRALVVAHYKVIVIDSRGQGRSRTSSTPTCFAS